jgi:hypothetical protein
MRPKTLAEVAQLTLDGDSFDRCLANFLDEFYATPNVGALADAPVLLVPTLGKQGQGQDAYLAATAEELARVHHFSASTWIAADVRKLHRPWFASPLAALRAVLLLESSAIFRARNLFVSENARPARDRSRQQLGIAVTKKLPGEDFQTPLATADQDR